MDFPKFWKILCNTHNSPIRVLPLPEGAHIKKDFLKKSPLLIASF